MLIPTFSLDRMPFIMWILYSLYHKSDNFNIPIIIDSPLAINLLNCYKEIMPEHQKKEFIKMLEWKNFKYVSDPEESKYWVGHNGSKIICASSGMLTAGRSVRWVQSILPNENDCILFIGYATNNTLAYKIKNYTQQQTINIMGKPYKNKCQIVDLHSFSSHMQRVHLLDYYSSINCSAIYLVHSEEHDRIIFKKDLESECSKNCMTTKIICANQSTKISL